MPEIGEYLSQHDRDELGEEKEESFEDEGDIEERIASTKEKLDDMMILEDNEELVAALQDALKSVEYYIETASNIGEWTEFLKEIDEIVELLSVDSIGDAYNKWLNAEPKLIQLKKKAVH